MKINQVFITGVNWALAGIISMLGFSGCDKIGTEEYGTPHADYTVKGAVVDKVTGKPIEGIRVGLGHIPYLGPMPMYGTLPTPYQPKVHVLTDLKGEFKLTDRFNAVQTLSVFVDDIDGEENGLFQSEYLQVDFSNAVQSGKPKGWYEGEYTVNVNVDLSPDFDTKKLAKSLKAD